MPIPLAIAGLPWLAGILGGLFTAVFGFLLKFFTKRFALFAAAVVGLLALFGVFLGAITGLMNGLSYVVPSEWILYSGYVLPANFKPCITALLSAHVARYVFSWNVKILQMKLGL
jgi:Family of unknown function (DUF5455)